MDMAFFALSSSLWHSRTSIPSTITAFSCFTMVSQSLMEFTSMSMYSPLLVRPSPRGAAKDMIWWGLKPSLYLISMPARRMAF